MFLLASGGSGIRREAYLTCLIIPPLGLSRLGTKEDNYYTRSTSRRAAIDVTITLSGRWCFTGGRPILGRMLDYSGFVVIAAARGVHAPLTSPFYVRCVYSTCGIIAASTGLPHPTLNSYLYNSSFIALVGLSRPGGITHELVRPTAWVGSLVSVLPSVGG